MQLIKSVSSCKLQRFFTTRPSNVLFDTSKALCPLDSRFLGPSSQTWWGILMLIGPVASTLVDPRMGTRSSWGVILCPGAPKKQPTVSRSSCESEYRAMANTAAELIWITHLLRELHVLPTGRPTILCDNQSDLFLTQNPVSHKRAKHIDLDYHFVRELVTSGKLLTMFVPTKLQVADIFTKSLPRHQFEQFRHMLRLGPPPVSLEGGY